MRNANNRQIKGDLNYRQRNDIHFVQSNQTPNPNRKIRMGGGNRSRNQAYHRQFELGRNRASGVRQRIQFNSTNDAKNRHFIRNRTWRQRTDVPMKTVSPTAWPNTYAPERSKTTMPTWSYTTTTTTTTTLPPSTSSANPMVISNDVTRFDDAQYQRQMEDIEQQRYEEKMRRKQEIIEQERRMEQERIQIEERQRAHHQMELDRRRQEMIQEQQRALEIERIQDEKKRQDLERREQNEMNRQRYEDEQKRLAEIDRQRNDRTSQQRALQTNEILEESLTTTMSPKEKRKLKLKRLHDRLSKLSPQEQEIFYKKRAERNKKRGTDHQLQNIDDAK